MRFYRKNSHEFQTLCSVGEDTIYIDPATGVAYNEEIAPSTAPAYTYDTAVKSMEDIYGEDVVSVRTLCAFLNLPVEQTVKTMYYKDEQ